ncbi:MAG: OB-fold domain-containing protein [Actinomycetota bacterium]
MLRPNVNGIPVPRPTGESAPYWEGCRDGELRFRRCTSCGQAVFEPRPICPSCHGTDLAWEVSSGEGAVYSWSIVWRPQTPAFEVPYAPAIVRLDDGFDMVTAIVGCEPDAIHDGQRVRVEFHAVDDDITLPFFAPT